MMTHQLAHIYLVLKSTSPLGDIRRPSLAGTALSVCTVCIDLIP